jgi:uncharacterized membrane protein YdjX (TVP38/TMEM64 family)
MSTDAASGKKLPVLKLAVAAVVVLGVAGALLLSGDPRALLAQGKEWVARAMDAVRAAGPFAFFAAMAVFPACGVPMLTFSLTVGSAFGPSLGMPMVVVWSLVAMVVNLTLTYGLARRGLRPLLEALVKRLGYKLPEVESGDVLDLIIILRVTPGIPFFVQNYLLGLAEVPAGKYFAVSCLIALPYCAAFVLFGNALVSGQGKLVLALVGLLAALAAGTQLVRRHYGEKRKSAVPKA